MHDNEYNYYLQKAYADYYRIGAVKCHVLGGKTVYFRQHGFRHFLRRKNGVRPLKDQFRRFSLLRFAKQIIESEKTKLVETRIINKAEYFSLAAEIVPGRLVNVVLRKISEGKLDFVSIMDRRRQK